MCIALVTLALLIAPALADKIKDDPGLVSDHVCNGNMNNLDDGTIDGQTDGEWDDIDNLLYENYEYLDFDRAMKAEFREAWGHKRVCAIVIPTDMHTYKGKAALNKPTKVWVPAFAVINSPALTWCVTEPFCGDGILQEELEEKCEPNAIPCANPDETCLDDCTCYVPPP